MDQFAAKWRYEMEPEDMKPSLKAMMCDPNFNPFSTGNSSLYPSSRNIEKDHQISHQPANPKTSCNVFISYSPSIKQAVPNDSPPFPSVNVISFGCGNTKPMPTNVNEVCTKSKSHVRPEAEVVLPMEINFSTPVDRVSGEENYAPSVEYYEEQIRKSGGGRDPLQAQVHILAERKRRQKLSERFVALSAMVPGLKKLDKASVLGGAIKHLKELEERVKLLEEDGKKRHYEESSVSCKRKRLNLTGDTSSSDVDFDGSQDTSLPEVDVRISGENVLIRAYCQTVDGIIKEILSEVEKLNLSVISSSAMPFSNTTLHITIIAQLDSDFCMTSEDLANNIRGFIMRLT